MEAKELELKDVMVGDWVDVRNDAAPNTPHVEKITPSHLLRDEHWYGIELTPEILEKNGFKQIDKKFICGEIDDDLIEIIPSINNSYRIKVSVADLMISCSIWCSHVHELQHALSLCRIEKEIVLV